MPGTTPLADEASRDGLLRTKLGPPRFARGLIERPHLLARLNEGAYRTVAIIRGPAGFGKTTVAAQWRRDLIAAGKQVAWISLDEGDNEEGGFLAYLTKALEHAECAFAKGVMSVYQPGSATGGMEIIRAIANDLCQYGREVYVVIDDFHHVRSDAIKQRLQELIALAPPHFHLVLVSRTETGLSLADLWMKDMVTQISLGDLRFNYSEAKAFLEHRCGEQISPADIETIYEASEGWIAAIQWIATRLQPTIDVQHLLSSYSEGRAGLATHMAQSIIDELPKDVESFVMKTSLVERLHPDLCEALTGRRDCRELLHNLESEKLCLLPVDNEPDWYRYHPIFQQFLRDRLFERYRADTKALTQHLCEWVGEHGPAYHAGIGRYLSQTLEDRIDVLDLHRRAAQWFETHGFAIQAVEHALSAGDVTMTLDLLEASAMELLEQAELNTLLAWHDRLPRRLVEARGRLMLAFGWAYCLTCQTEKARAISQTLLDNHADYANVKRFEAASLHHAVDCYLDDGESASQLAEYLPTDGDAFHVGAGTNVLAFAYALTGRYEETHAILCKAAHDPKISDAYFPSQFRSCIGAMVLCSEGRFAEAETKCRTSLELAEEKHGRRSLVACLATGLLAQILYETDRLDEVDDLLRNRFDVINRGVFPDGLIRAHLYGARTFFALGRIEEAHDVLERLNAYALSVPCPRAQAIYLAQRAQFALHQQNLQEALKVQAELDRIDKTEGSDTPSARIDIRFIARQSKIRCLIETGEFVAAQALIDGLE
ncbi:MAG: hypothetical protein AAGF19_02335, partial [Pseudomonadota bacterium]